MKLSVNPSPFFSEDKPIQAVNLTVNNHETELNGNEHRQRQVFYSKTLPDINIYHSCGLPPQRSSKTDHKKVISKNI